MPWCCRAASCTSGPAASHPRGAMQHPAEVLLLHIHAATRLRTMCLESADAVQCSGSGGKQLQGIRRSAAANRIACASSTRDQTCIGPADWNTGVLYFVLMLLQSGTGKPAVSKDRPTAPLGSGYAPCTCMRDPMVMHQIRTCDNCILCFSRPSTRPACVVTLAGSRRGVQLPKFGCTYASLTPARQACIVSCLLLLSYLLITSLSTVVSVTEATSRIQLVFHQHSHIDSSANAAP